MNTDGGLEDCVVVMQQMLVADGDDGSAEVDNVAAAAAG